jgi:hypothetical protein
MDSYAPVDFMDRYIRTARHMLAFGAEECEIHQSLRNHGASEEEIYLAMSAAKLI